MKTLIVVDMQNDFISGNLGSIEAQKIVSNVVKKVKEYKNNGDTVIFTMDTHYSNYSETHEGKYLPVLHCIENSNGWKICDELDEFLDDSFVIKKETFGNLFWKEQGFDFCKDEVIEIVGLCTDICVISNALILRALFPENEIIVDMSCCAAVDEKGQNAAAVIFERNHIKVV